MTAKEVRNWLGIYFLLATTIVGTFILLAGGSPLLPIEKPDKSSAFQIIVPVFMAQLALIFRFFATGEQTPNEKLVSMPAWVIKGPPLVIVAIFAVTVLVMAVGNAQAALWTPSGEEFKGVVTFCVSLLNATTVLLVGSYFRAIAEGNAKPSAPSRSQKES